MKARAHLLLSMAVILSILTGCDSGSYSAEKRFYHASKKYVRLIKNSEKATSADYREVIDALREITLRYPAWTNTPTAQFYIAQLYASQDNLDKAKEEFEVILKEYPDKADTCAAALFSIAVIYEMKNNWNKALETLDKLTKDYPDTKNAFEAPLFIAEHYKKKKETAQAEAAYLAALEKYKKTVRDNSTTYGALVAVDFVMACYSEQDKWDEAIGYLNSVIADFPYPETLLPPKATFIAGTIYHYRLNQPQKALEYYRAITEKYQKATIFVKLAEQQIELIKKTK